MVAEKWKSELMILANPEKAKILSRFFKTGKSEYGEGDIFIGITVPQNRAVAKKYLDTQFDDIEKLLHSPIHELRLSALLALVLKFKKHKDDNTHKSIVDFYLANTSYINNWDLVDLSCLYILGEYLYERPHDVLFRLSESTNMWEQRIAIVSTLAFIRKGKFDTTLVLAEKFITHKHDLMHKATGWMLREIGKKNTEILRAFLEKHAHNMPRTALRYAIEKFTPKERKHYLSIKKTE